MFGTRVTELADHALRALWRTTSPQLWSARAPEERNSTPYLWIYGLCGVAAEAETPAWATCLSPSEARTAAAYASLELNGFAPFIVDLVESHPTEVEAVIGNELSAELKSGSDHDHLPTLQDLTYADSRLRKLLVPRLLCALPTWPTTFTDETGPRWAHHLDQILRILGDTSSNAERRTIANECATRYEADSTGHLALIWLRGLFRFDSVHGAQLLIAGFTASTDADIQRRAVRTFANLFGDRDEVFFEIADPAQRASVLGDLVRYVYAFVRREDDRIHEGVYTPDARDKAETARNFLLAALLDTPGQAAVSIVLELSSKPDFGHFPDRLRQLARQRTAADAEFPPFEPIELIALEGRYEAPPHHSSGLFAVMLDRLGDLAHDIAHHDFTDRRTLRAIDEEVEMQRTLALRLVNKANGAYVVTREDEVADLKRTDIRLSAVRGDQRVVAEVKIADKRWSLTDFERALRNQLVGQYLRHTTCRAGCLLLTYNGEKKYWEHPETKQQLEFVDVIAFLNQKAHELETEKFHEIRLAVVGLDLTDPPLASARRGGY